MHTNNSFLDEYAQYSDITKSIILGQEQSEVCQIFGNYFGRLFKALYMHPEFNSISNEDKEGISEQIYDFAMLYIFQKIFPKEPTLDDQLFAAHIKKMSMYDQDHFEIKKQNQHSELWDIAIKRTAYTK